MENSLMKKKEYPLMMSSSQNVQRVLVNENVIMREQNSSNPKKLANPY